MSEVIGEMILPGTYIEVRAEGLIGVGGISTGNVGVVGTANRGPFNTAVILGSYTEALDTFGAYDRWPGTAEAPALTLTRTLEQLFKGGASTVYAVRVGNLPAATPSRARTFTINDGAGTPVDLIELTATSPGTWAVGITATMEPAGDTPTQLTLIYNRAKEVYPLTAKASDLVQAINEGSRIVSAGLLGADDAAKTANGNRAPKKAVDSVAGGPDGVAATPTELASGLAQLSTQPVNMVVAAGFDAKTAAGTMLAHLEETENDGRERIAIIGASTDDVANLVTNDVAAASNPRFVLVAPGILADDAARVGVANKQVRLTAPYAAALVAGRLSTLAPHISLTNKDVAADGLTREYTRAEQKNLLNNRVLVLQKNLGIRVLKGVSTDTGAFRQISVRRIVDYAKAGVRIGANPYIGRLNNARVRSALKATLDGFLSGMVLDEMLIGYQLDVSATRAQEINGIALVTMTLQPTFSIDFVRVIMNLS